MSEDTGRKSGPNVLFIAVVVVLVAALAVEAFLLLRPKPPARPAEARAAVAAGASQRIETIGEDSAPIEIDFYAPLSLEWHQKTIGLLREYNDEHPGRIFVRLMPMGNAECDAEINAKGITCAVIFINDENQFTLPDGRTVELYQRPNQSTSSYNSEDVITILEQMP
jgi:hypothetical protein